MVDNSRVRGEPDGSQSRMTPGGWQRVVGLGIVTTAATVLTIVTGSPEQVIGVIAPLLPFLPR